MICREKSYYILRPTSLSRSPTNTSGMFRSIVNVTRLLPTGTGDCPLGRSADSDLGKHNIIDHPLKRTHLSPNSYRHNNPYRFPSFPSSSSSSRCVYHALPEPKYRGIARCEAFASMYITYISVSKCTPLAVTGPNGQLAS